MKCRDCKEEIYQNICHNCGIVYNNNGKIVGIMSQQDIEESYLEVI